MAGLRQARDLPQPELPPQQADLLIRQQVGGLDAVEDRLVRREAGAGHRAAPALAVGEQVEALGEEPEGELRAVAPAIEDDGDPALADERANLGEHGRQHLHQARIRLGRDREEGLARRIVDPVVGGRGQGQQHARVRHPGPGAEERGGILQHAQVGEQPIQAAVGGIRIERHREGLVAGRASRGQVGVPQGRLRLRAGGRRRGGKSGQVWVPAPSLADPTKTRALDHMSGVLEFGSNPIHLALDPLDGGPIPRGGSPVRSLGKF